MRVRTRRPAKPADDMPADGIVYEEAAPPNFDEVCDLFEVAGAIMPSQREERAEHAFTTGARALWLSCFSRALADMRLPEGNEDGDDARQWLDDDGDAIGSFVWIAQHVFRADPTLLREGIKARMAAGRLRVPREQVVQRPKRALEAA